MKAMPSSLSFSAKAGMNNPISQAVQLTEVEGSWAAKKTHPWLVASPLSGSGDSGIEVSAHVAGLKVGSYKDTLVITPATGAPVSIPVTLQVS